MFINFHRNNKIATISTIHIKTKAGHPQEEKVKNILENILTKYDLSPYTFTDTVRIENNAIPHSHPVLTLNTRKLGGKPYSEPIFTGTAALVSGREKTGVEGAITGLRETYPEVPVGVPEGAYDEYSTYLHLLLLPLEYKLTKKFTGEATAKEVFEDQPVYWRIRRATVNDYEFLMALIKKHGLDLDGNNDNQNSSDRQNIFNSVCSGKKSVESLAATPNYHNVQPGDKLTFTCVGVTCHKTVKNVRYFSTIDALMEYFSLESIHLVLGTIQEIKNMYYGFPG